MARNLEPAKVLIRKWEGLRLKAYLCPAGKWTIGYGQTKGIRPCMVWTKEQAEADLDRDIQLYAAALEKRIRPDTTDNEFCAFLSLAWNVGPVAVRDSTALMLHNKRARTQDVQNAIMAWNKATVDGKKVVLKGLTNRRADEVQLYALRN